ncbi:MAG: alanine racemase [Bacteroidota bacterium]|nr:alanine racemase [Bacteroidota bacterium]
MKHLSLSHETILSVDLNILENNFQYFKKKLNPNTKIIGVVKAYAYGYGDIEISKKLEAIGVAALWVSDFEEGIALRSSGIKIPIIVANPGTKSYHYFLKYQLEPVIYNFELLNIFADKLHNLNIHVKFNTGMNRYGFNVTDLPQLCLKLKNATHLKVKSICSHLAASNNIKRDDFTISQFNKFDTIFNKFAKIHSTKPMRHILNSSGVLQFPKMQFDMVRIGIGLYGSCKEPDLMQIGVLKSVVAQIQNVKKNSFIGYEPSFLTNKDMQVAIIPFGYADGLNRKLGDGEGGVFINNDFCRIVGKISMDSCLVDITNKNVSVGDKVEIFGENIKVTAIANQLNTIPYEILSVLNRRIKRIYLNE